MLEEEEARPSFELALRRSEKAAEGRSNIKGKRQRICVNCRPCECRKTDRAPEETNRGARSQESSSKNRGRINVTGPFSANPSLILITSWFTSRYVLSSLARAGQRVFFFFSLVFFSPSSRRSGLTLLLLLLHSFLRFLRSTWAEDALGIQPPFLSFLSSLPFSLSVC